MIGCTEHDCEAEAVRHCDSCAKARCEDHVEHCESTDEWFCNIGCGGTGRACSVCRVRRVAVDGLCWHCRKVERAEAVR
jgi:hypothetical protein